MKKLYNTFTKSLFSPVLMLIFMLNYTNKVNNPDSCYLSVEPKVEEECSEVIALSRSEILKIEWDSIVSSIKDDKARKYIAKFSQVAVAEYSNTPLRPSVKMAQAIIESGYGSSSLARNNNAHFGVKSGWKSKKANGKVVKKDDTPRDVFNTYSEASDSWSDHSDLLKIRRYERVLNPNNTVQECCYYMGKSGYATCQYVTYYKDKKTGEIKTSRAGNQLLKVIKKYNLEKLDALVGL